MYQIKHTVKNQFGYFDMEAYRTSQKQYNEEKDNFLEKVWDALQSENLTVTRSEDQQSIVCSFQEAIDDTQQIEAELTIAAPQKDGDACYQITGWQVKQKNEWKADTGLPVMQRE